MLKKQGIIIDKTNSKYKKPLDVAVLGEHIEIVSLIIDSYRDTNYSDIFVCALLNGSAITVSFMLNKYIINVDSRIKSLDNQTPLQHAARYGHLEIVRILLATGADKHLRDSRYLNALDWAVQNSHR